MAYSGGVELVLAWQRVASWLQRNAPASHAALMASSGRDIRALEGHLGYPLPTALRDWFATVGGTSTLTFAAQVLPAQVVLTASAAQKESASKRSVWIAGPDRGVDELLESAGQQPAGGMAWGWLPTFVPIGIDGAGGGYVVDLRPGPLRGCVKQFSRDDGALYPPVWRGVDELLDDVAESLESGRSCHRFRPAVDTSGQLRWHLAD